MNKNIRLGIVGFGYWGRIILQNLEQLGYNNLVICETNNIDWSTLGRKYEVVRDFKHLVCDKVFIITPATTHYHICEYFLSRGVDVFCEKPLDITIDKCLRLYELSYEHKSQLFVDWIFTYNPAVHQIKNIIDNKGKPTNIIANRMNLGPVRNETPHNIQWLDFSRNSKSHSNDSTVGVLSFSKTCVQINASWSYKSKNRLYILEFDDGFLYWDDTLKTITFNGEVQKISNVSPLHTSIEHFLDGGSNKDQTIEITKILCNEC